MGLFSRVDFLEPQREATDFTSRALRKIEAERKRIEAERVRLSEANITHTKLLQDFLERKAKAELDVQRARARLKAAPSRRRELDHDAAMSRLFNLTQRVARLQSGIGFLSRLNGLGRVAGSTAVRSSAAKASAGDRRFSLIGSFVPNARTIFGTEAFTRVEKLAAAKTVFLTPHLTIPCIQRVVRREVMFATRKAGRGHRKAKRFNVFSHIGC